MTDTLSGRVLLGVTLALGVVIQIIVLIVGSADDSIVPSLAAFVAAGVYAVKFALPAVVILAVTGEWTQRATMVTFTLVPNRGRVLAAKLGASLAVALVVAVVTVAFAAILNQVYGVTTGNPVVWDVDPQLLAEQVVPLLYFTVMAFGLAVAALNSSAALVGYYLATFAVPKLLSTLYMVPTLGRVSSILSWIDPTAIDRVQHHATGSDWAHFAVSATVWAIVPLAIGVRRVLTTEIK